MAKIQNNFMKRIDWLKICSAGGSLTNIVYIRNGINVDNVRSIYWKNKTVDGNLLHEFLFVLFGLLSWVKHIRSVDRYDLQMPNVKLFRIFRFRKSVYSFLRMNVANLKLTLYSMKVYTQNYELVLARAQFYRIRERKKHQWMFLSNGIMPW